MIKAVFLDLYHTLVGYDPPREQLQAEALKELGVDADATQLRWPLVTADEFIYKEMARVPMGQRDEKSRMALWAEYQRVFLREAGIAPEEKLVLGLLGKMRQVKMNLRVFDDVAPALDDLKAKGFVLGLISNIDHDITPMLQELGLEAWLEIVVTSQDAGATKPDPQIFRVAAQRAGVKPGEAVFVGDQYQIDVIGARNAGMKGILLDRGDFFGEITDAPRIHSLTQIAAHL
ncbi:MAG: HAD family hydrolase [Chloroflexota bacterium]